jgi:hypothetical protein
MDDVFDFDLPPGLPVGLILRAVTGALQGWDERDVHHYFRLAYRSRDFAIAVDSNNDAVARMIAAGVVEDMRSLRASDVHRRLR